MHCLPTRRFVASGHGVRTGKGLLLCMRKPKWSKNEKERQPPEGVPRHSAAGKGIPNLSGRTDFIFKRKWQVVCCGTRNEFRASPPPCPLDVASPSGVGGCSRGRAVGIRRFQTMFHLKFYRMMDNQKKYAGNHGRKPKPDKMRHRYVFRLDDGDNARFLRFSTSRARRPRRSLSFPHFSEGRLRSLNWIRGRRISTCA